MIWIMLPLVAFVIFGLYVRREAERIRAEDARPRVVVKLKLAGDGMATPDEVHLRQTIEDGIEKSSIGAIVDTASGGGWATVQVAVDDPERACQEIRRLIDALGIDHAVIEVATAVP